MVDLSAHTVQINSTAKKHYKKDKVELQSLGYATFKLKVTFTEKKEPFVIYVDPWFAGNP